MNIQSFFWKQNFFSGIIRKRIQLKLFVHQTLRYEKNLQGEIAIRGRDIAINKKVPLECSDDGATHQYSMFYILHAGY